MSPKVLLLPGWHNSGERHWQTLWQEKYGYEKVEQHSWDFPLRGDWMSRLEDEVSQHEQVILVAHDLGCLQVAAWANFSTYVDRVVGALLVAPGDVEREELRHVLYSWSPIERHKLPFDSVVAISRNDPYCSFMRACKLASDWGARVIDMGHSGHLNAESGLGEWTQGHDVLKEFSRMVA
jgi:uncharacterized protein